MTAAPEPLVVLCTVPDAPTGERLARALVEERLAACVNLVPGLTSIYRWQGEVARDSELLLVIKAQRSALAALVERVRTLHPYEVPELIALPIVAGSPDYLAWLAASTRPEDTRS
jgi:periplasmic divalent cation tolerance protein